jgi:hypothetical protein
VKKQKEEKYTFREGLLLVSFLFLLFSFSGKSFGRPSEKSLHSEKFTYALKTAVVDLSGVHSQQGLIKGAAYPLPGNYLSEGSFECSAQNKKILTADKCFISKSILLMPGDQTRFYYRIFSHQGVEFPSSIRFS